MSKLFISYRDPPLQGTDTMKKLNPPFLVKINNQIKEQT
jgi:hypothetical protein